MKTVLAILSGLLLSACATVAPQVVTPVADIAPPTASAPLATKSFVYTRTLVKSPVAEPYETLSVGAACMPRAMRAFSQAEVEMADPAIERAFVEEFAKAGYRVVGAIGSSETIIDKKDIVADYRIVAVITNIKMNVCYPLQRQLYT